MLFRNNNRHECTMNGLLGSKLEVGHGVTFGSGRRVRSGSVQKSSSFCRATLWQSVAVTTTLTCVRRVVAGEGGEGGCKIAVHRASARERERTSGDSLSLCVGEYRASLVSAPCFEVLLWKHESPDGGLCIGVVSIAFSRGHGKREK